MSDDDRPMPDAVHGPAGEAESASSVARPPIPDAVRPSEAILARAMTVEASKLYALINLRHLAGELDRP